MLIKNARFYNLRSFGLDKKETALALRAPFEAEFGFGQRG